MAFFVRSAAVLALGLAVGVWRHGLDGGGGWSSSYPYPYPNPYPSSPAASPPPCAKSTPPPFALRSRRVVAPGGEVDGIVIVEGGKIVDVLPAAAERALGVPVLDVGAAAVLPGAVDVHAHLNEPGGGDRVDWEGFETGTRAAAAGGVTTVVDMPLNSVPTTVSAAALAAKLAAASAPGKLHVDVGFWGGLVPENAHDAAGLEALLDGGVLGLKAFQSPSGIPDFGNANETHMAAALPLLKKRGLPLLVHAELPPPDPPAPSGPPTSYATYMATRPREWERAALEVLVRVARDTGAHIHVVHLSDADSLPLLAEARAEGLPITVETCTHYLAFAAEEVPDGATAYKCAPPIREAENRDRLWGALLAGTLDSVSSDHSPAPPGVKRLEDGDFLKAWGGIAGLQFSLPATWARASRRGATLSQLAEWWSAAPARIAGLSRKGAIAPGKDADLVVFAPDEEYVEEGPVYHRHKLTPYSGHKMRGRVLKTFVRGNVVYDAAGGGTFAACGEPLLRP